jgi:hypothetical protein
MKMGVGIGILLFIIWFIFGSAALCWPLYVLCSPEMMLGVGLCVVGVRIMRWVWV